MRILIALLVTTLCMLPQTVEARGGGGGGSGGGGHGGGSRGGGGGFHGGPGRGGGGTVGFFNAGNFGFSNFTPNVGRSGIARGHQPFRANRQVIRSNRFDGQRVGHRNRFDRGQQWVGLPAVGWVGGGYSGYNQPAPAEPQVIVMPSASGPPPAQRVTVIGPTDYNYAGCQAIPNGYRCAQ